MKPVIAERTEDKRPRPAQLKLEVSGGTVRLREMQSTAVLLTFGADGVCANRAAGPLLKAAGVDTAFARWSSEGKMLLEDS